jgi:two-component system cell cycle sensor histidine kinase/response regulator CckA
VDQPEDKGTVALPFAEAPRGTEKILLAEDEQDVREVAREFLESGGYTVIEACNGAEAMRLAAEHSATIDLLVTDMVMPGMTGRDLARRLKHQRSGMGVIYMSGYSEQTAAETTQVDADMRLLTKPFSRGSILRAVREALNVARNS